MATFTEAQRWAMRVDKVLDSYGDPEEGHCEEDDLLADFVRAVARGTLSDPRPVASDIADRLLTAKRTRWYA